MLTDTNKAEESVSEHRVSHVCPHCGNRLYIRTSKPISELTRQYAMQCRNPVCSATFVVSMEIIREIVPSGIPNSAIRLPRSSKAEAMLFATAADKEIQKRTELQGSLDLQDKNTRAIR